MMQESDWCRDFNVTPAMTEMNSFEPTVSILVVAEMTCFLATAPATALASLSEAACSSLQQLPLSLHPSILGEVAPSTDLVVGSSMESISRAATTSGKMCGLTA